MNRYFVSLYTDGPATRWNVIDRRTQEWVRRFASEAEASDYATKRSRRMKMLIDGTTFARQVEADPDLDCEARSAESLAETIRTRLLGVAPEDQDVVLEDADWRIILKALSLSNGDRA